jgi:hypothetical protein
MPHSESTSDSESPAEPTVETMAEPVIGEQDDLDIDIAMEDAPEDEKTTPESKDKKAANLAEDLFGDDDLDEAITSSGGVGDALDSSSPDEPSSSAYDAY